MNITLVKSDGFKKVKVVVDGINQSVTVTVSVAAINSYGAGSYSVAQEMTMNEQEAETLIQEQVEAGFSSEKEKVVTVPVVKKSHKPSKYVNALHQACAEDEEWNDDQNSTWSSSPRW